MARGEHQGVEAHGHHHLHPCKEPDGVVGSTGVLKNIVRGFHVGGGLLTCAYVQPFFDGKKNRGEAVSFPGIVGRPAKEFRLFFVAGPGPQRKADISAFGIQAPAFQHAVDDLRPRGGKDHRGIGGEEDLGVVNAHVLQLGKGVGVPESDHIHVALQNPGAQAAVGGIVDGADAAAVHQHPVAQLFGG